MTPPLVSPSRHRHRWHHRRHRSRCHPTSRATPAPAMSSALAPAMSSALAPARSWPQVTARATPHPVVAGSRSILVQRSPAAHPTTRKGHAPRAANPTRCRNRVHHPCPGRRPRRPRRPRRQPRLRRGSMPFRSVSRGSSSTWARHRSTLAASRSSARRSSSRASIPRASCS